MASLNQVTLLGNLTRDVELKYLASGTTVANTGLAMNRKWKTQDGELREEVCFVDIAAFGSQADVMAKYVGKGDLLLIVGRLKLDQWEDRDTGAKRSKLSIVVESLQLMPKRDGGGGSGEQDSGRQQQAPAGRRTRPAPAPAPARESVSSEDIPF